jgi:ATP-dependent Clp protease adaptor protein ClpS
LPVRYGKIESMPEFPEFDTDVLAESETKLEKPKLFKVILHNDDFTTMEFVVFVLEFVFNRTEIDAFSIMLKVHTEGMGIAGIYPYEIASMKSEKAMNLARSREYPLLCTVEEE